MQGPLSGLYKVMGFNIIIESSISVDKKQGTVFCLV